MTRSTAPLVKELVPAPGAEEMFRQLSCLPKCLFLDSALRTTPLGRYSFIAADPYYFFSVDPGDSTAFSRLATALGGFPVATLPDLPPFQGGAAGLLSYDLCRSLERVAPPKNDEFGLPGMAIGVYDVVLAFDHQQDRAWLISQGAPEHHPAARQRRARERLRFFSDHLQQGNSPRKTASDASISRQQLAECYPTSSQTSVLSNFSRADYLATVQRAIDYIHAGDIFQVNLSQRLLCRSVSDAVSLYLRLRQRNPATFAGFFDLGSFQIVSASPERFLQLRDRSVEARPIKGTRPRTLRPEADLFSAAELAASEKDVAENVMIVDLMRNDLSRVCEADSVQVAQLCQLETYEFVQHLVSVVCGTLAEQAQPVDLLTAAFPGGSITGAPKVRAMEIIAELEPTARGAYCGSLGYLGFDGAMDWNILIRTITAGRGWWQFPVGGGIVAQSDPVAEYEETWHKAEGILRSLR